MESSYTKPTLTVLGSVQDLTLLGPVKSFTGSPDGIFLKVGKTIVPLAS